MEFPKLPTDNLYKFAALTGLVVFIFPMGLVSYLMIWENNHIFDIQRDTAIIEIQSKYLLIGSDKEEYAPPNVEVVKALEVSLASLKVDLEESHDSLELIRRFFWVSVIFSVGGFGFAVWGFRNWYIRLQHPSDLLLKAKIHKMLLDIEKNIASSQNS